MIVENLAGSGLFTVVDINSYGDTVSAIDEPKIFSQRHQIDARAFLIGRVAESTQGLEISVRLWDVPADKQLTEQQYAIDRDNLRGTADRISDLIRHQLAGR
jgi:Tol biopolymer transport system component